VASSRWPLATQHPPGSARFAAPRPIPRRSPPTRPLRLDGRRPSRAKGDPLGQAEALRRSRRSTWPPGNGWGSPDSFGHRKRLVGHELAGAVDVQATGTPTRSRCRFRSAVPAIIDPFSEAVEPRSPAHPAPGKQ
jgi:hypothetical protein